MTPDGKGTVLQPRKPFPPAKVNLHEISAYDYIQAYSHEHLIDTPGEHEAEDVPSGTSTLTGTSGSGTDPDNPLLAHLTKRSSTAKLPPGHMQRMLSSSLSKTNKSKADTPAVKIAEHEIVINGNTYRQVNMAQLKYSVSAAQHRRHGALIDRGANGGVAGNDVRVIARTTKTVDVQGIDNHQITDIPIITAGALINTQRGPVIAILHQFAYVGKGKTIISSGQMEWFGQTVNNKSIKV